jgi:large subunit ribosomal protein L30
MPDRLRVRLRKSPISYTAKTRGTVRALGLHRLHETVEIPDNPATRGMVRAVRFLVEVEEVTDQRAAPARRRAPAKAAAQAPGAGAPAPEVPAETAGLATEAPVAEEEAE